MNLSWCTFLVQVALNPSLCFLLRPPARLQHFVLNEVRGAWVSSFPSDVLLFPDPGGDTRRTTKYSDLYIKPRSVDFDWVRQVTSIVHLSERLRGPLVNIARLGKVSRLLSTSNTLQLVTICRYLQYILNLQA